MADDDQDQNQNQNQNQDQSESDSPQKSEEISLEGIDKAIEEDDPDFAKSMEEMSQDNELTNADVDPVEIDESSFLDADDIEQKGKEFLKRHPLINKLLQPVFKTKTRLQSRGRAFFNRVKLSLGNFLLFLRTGLPEFLKYLKTRITSFFGFVKQQIDRVRSWSWPLKMGALLVVFLVVASSALLQMTLTGRWLPSLEPQPVYNLGSLAHSSSAFEINQLTKFYRSFPEPQHIVQLEKIKVNLKRENAYENPMAAFQLYFNADSQDTAAEVKHREKEFMDLVARAAESLTYKELSKVRGKERLKSLAMKRINGSLNQGRVVRAYFKIIVLKP